MTLAGPLATLRLTVELSLVTTFPNWSSTSTVTRLSGSLAVPVLTGCNASLLAVDAVT